MLDRGPEIDQYRRPYAFLSSICRELGDVRAEIFERGRGVDGRLVYVDERVFPILNGAEPSPLETTDHLLRTLRQSEIVIVLLGGTRHGSPIEVEGHASRVSYFEIELFCSAVLRKPIFLYVLEGFSPEPQLRSLLEILGPGLPRWSSGRRWSARDVVEDIELLLRSRRRLSDLQPWMLRRPAVHLLAQRLYGARQSHLQFLSGRMGVEPDGCNADLVQKILNEQLAESNEEQRLSRLWIAVRELMRAPYTASRHADLLPLWNRVLSRWASSAAWYGLHGYLELGQLAALLSMAEVRRRMQLLPGHADDPSAQYPGGPLASARYSSAKLLLRPRDRSALRHEALSNVERALAGPGRNRANLLAIRGSIRRVSGDLSGAIGDYEEVLQLRQEMGAGPGAVGEALSELGYAYLLKGSLRRGREMMAEAVRLCAARERRGFLVRAKRKLSVAYLATGHPMKAHDEWIEARALARHFGVFGQIGDWRDG